MNATQASVTTMSQALSRHQPIALSFGEGSLGSAEDESAEDDILESQ